MRHIKTTTAIATVIILCACGEAAWDGDFSGYHESGTTPDPEGPGTSEVEPGQLTAGDWDDNANLDLYLEYEQESRSAVPDFGGMEVSDRIVVTVVDGAGEAVPGTLVTVSADGLPLVSAPVGADGRMLVFPGWDGASPDAQLSCTVDPPAGADLAPVTVDLDGTDTTVVLEGASGELPTALDVAFVIDTTGSMWDEIDYIQAEIQGIVDAVHDWQAGLDTRWALVVYRDLGDAYVTRFFDFTGDAASFRSDLADQSAGGGGDYPEAMEKALGQMNQLSWRDGNVARVVFLIADAPPHPENAGVLVDEADEARRAGIRIFPVAASGVADSAEYLMRACALLTLGRYVFLTDDSGIGNSHAEPHLPCYQVQILADVMVRMILSTLAGEHVPPHPDTIIRTVGDPVDGVCTLEDGSLAYL